MPASLASVITKVSYTILPELSLTRTLKVFSKTLALPVTITGDPTNAFTTGEVIVIFGGTVGLAETAGVGIMASSGLVFEVIHHAPKPSKITISAGKTMLLFI